MPNVNTPELDPFESFATQAERTTSIDPSEVRSLGNRRRTRRRLAVGASSFVVVLLASVLALSQSGIVGQRDPEVAASPSAPPTASTVTTPSASRTSQTPSPTPSQTPSDSATPTASSTPTSTPVSSATPSGSPATTPSGSASGSGTESAAFGPVTAANLPTTELIVNGPWTSTTSVGWQSSSAPCAGAFTLAGAQHVQRRFFIGQGNQEGSTATAYVMDFATAKQATAAAKSVAATYQRCATTTLIYQTEAPPLTTAPQKSPVTPVSAQAHRLLPEDIDNDSAVNALVIQVGPRLMWVYIVELYGYVCSVAPSYETCALYANANDLALLLMSN